MLVMKFVANRSPLAAAHHKSEEAEDSKLMGDGRALHLDCRCELTDRMRAGVQATQYAKPARGSEGLDGLRDLRCPGLVDQLSRVCRLSVTHAREIS